MNFEKYIFENDCTLLGLGPMSKNCVDVVIDLANSFNVPLMLIASRRQIESEKLGKGYVNNWSTEEFAKYVKDRDKNECIVLCRDHGGPYQNEKNKNESVEEAMKDAKESFEIDIKSDFKIIHIDPSQNLTSDSKIEEMLERIFELYEFCYKIAKQNQKQIEIEISIGKEDGEISKLSEIKFALDKMEEFCSTKKLPLPKFIVLKTGNHVLETKNIGMLENIMNGKDDIAKKEIIEMIKLCKEKKILIKEHNGDYLSDKTLREHPRIGIDAVNVAPEFGVTETRSILSYCVLNELDNFKQKFLDISFNSAKWKKWMIPDSTINNEQKAIISGHYVFSNDEFQKLKNGIGNLEDFDNFLKNEIKISIMRYLKCLKLIK